MNYLDQIRNFKNIALVGMSQSIYNEDATTAMELTLITAKKARECMEVVHGLCEMIEALNVHFDVDYTEEEKELNLTLEARLEEVKTEADKCYSTPFNEDAMSVLELAGCTAQHVNECIRVINMFADVVKDVMTRTGIAYDEENKMIILGGE